MLVWLKIGAYRCECVFGPLEHWGCGLDSRSKHGCISAFFCGEYSKSKFCLFSRVMCNRTAAMLLTAWFWRIFTNSWSLTNTAIQKIITSDRKRNYHTWRTKTVCLSSMLVNLLVTGRNQSQSLVCVLWEPTMTNH